METRPAPDQSADGWRGRKNASAARRGPIFIWGVSGRFATRRNRPGIEFLHSGAEKVAATVACLRGQLPFAFRRELGYNPRSRNSAHTQP